MKHSFLHATAAIALLSSAAFAQAVDPTLTGSFILVEEGTGVSQPVASLAILNFMSGGTVAGTHIMRGPGMTVKNSVQGTYSMKADGSGNLALSYQTPQTEDNQPIVTSFNYQLRWSKTGGVVAIRTDTGLFSIAVLTAAAPAGPIKGGFLLVERANGTPYAGLGYLGLDGANGITGSEQVAALGSNTVSALTGAYAVGTDGFGSMTLNFPSVNSDGNTVYTAANYVFAVGVNQLYAIRTDGGAAFISTLTATP